MCEVTLQLSPPPSLVVMHVDELAAALQKLGITNVSATKVVREEQVHKHKAHFERGKALLRREPITLVKI